MAEKKVFMDSDNRVFFICPRCDRAQRQDVSAYRHHNRPVRLAFTCETCGGTASVVLERRSHYRVQVGKPGTYGTLPGPPDGTITVLDLSRTGIRVELDHDRGFKTGDRFWVAFTLPNEENTQKDAVVVHCADRIVRAEFLQPLDLPPGTVV